MQPSVGMAADALELLLKRRTVHTAPYYQQFDAYRGRYAGETVGPSSASSLCLPESCFANCVSGVGCKCQDFLHCCESGFTLSAGHLSNSMQFGSKPGVWASAASANCHLWRVVWPVAYANLCSTLEKLVLSHKLSHQVVRVFYSSFLSSLAGYGCAAT